MNYHINLSKSSAMKTIIAMGIEMSLRRDCREGFPVLSIRITRAQNATITIIMRTKLSIAPIIGISNSFLNLLIPYHYYYYLERVSRGK